MSESNGKKAAVEFFLYAAAVAGLAFFLIQFAGQRTLVSGASMEPALCDGDSLIVDKLTYRWREPERFDIIVFPQEDGVYYIKRIIGMPGERVRIDEKGGIYINGARMSESYGKEVIDSAGMAGEEIRIGDGEYFVMGDNRNNSMDSRDGRVGLVQREDIIGRAYFRILPLERIGLVDHRQGDRKES